MKQTMKQSVLIAALLALGLAGCQKQEEAPAPEVMEPEAPAPLTPMEPMPEAPAPGVEPAPMDAPMEPVPGEAGEAAPMQPAPDDASTTAPSQ